MADTFDFVRASRDALLDALPLKPGLVDLLKAVDRIALRMIDQGDPDAYVDDGQELVAEIPLGTLAQAMRVHEATARRRLHAASETPYLSLHESNFRAHMLCLHWPAITARRPLATCKGSHPELLGVASADARGSTSKTPRNQGGSRYPSHFLSDSESNISTFSELRVRASDTGAAVCEGSHAPSLLPPGSQPPAAGFFAPELSDQLPWQRLTDEHLQGLDPRMLAVLYVESVRSEHIADSYDGRKFFLAAAYHCAQHRGLAGSRARVLCGRVLKRNYRGLMDAAWDWSRQQMDAGRARGMAVYIQAAMDAYQRKGTR